VEIKVSDYNSLSREELGGLTKKQLTDKLIAMSWLIKNVESAYSTYCKEALEACGSDRDSGYSFDLLETDISDYKRKAREYEENCKDIDF
jgi:hypothetical protein